MAKKIEPANQMTTSTSSSSALPEYLRDKPVLGTEVLREYMVIPRIRIVQKQSDGVSVETYGVGTVLVQPNAVVLFKKESKVTIVPMLFYPEWITVNDIKLKGQEPFILHQTTDPNDPIVKKSRDPQQRVEKHPVKSDLKIKHLEVLNFVVKIIGHEGFEDLAVLSFAGSGHKDGRRFNNLINARGASIFAGKYELSVTPRKNNQGDWYGFSVANPTEDPWVSAEQFAVYEEGYKKVQDTFKAGNLKAAGEAEVDEEVPEKSNEM